MTLTLIPHPICAGKRIYSTSGDLLAFIAPADHHFFRGTEDDSDGACSLEALRKSAENPEAKEPDWWKSDEKMKGFDIVFLSQITRVKPGQVRLPDSDCFRYIYIHINSNHVLLRIRRSSLRGTPTTLMTCSSPSSPLTTRKAKNREQAENSGMAPRWRSFFRSFSRFCGTLVFTRRNRQYRCKLFAILLTGPRVSAHTLSTRRGPNGKDLT